MPINSSTERDASDGNTSPEAQLLKQLSQRDEVDLLGVVDAGGISGSSSRGDELWTLMFCLAAWKYRGEPVRKRKLTVRKKVAKEEFGSTRTIQWTFRLPAGLHIRLQKTCAVSNLQ